MFHIVFSVTSRFLFLRNILQGIARGLLALRSLDTISSYLTPALPPPPPVPLLNAPVPFAERPEQIMFPYPSRDVIAIQRQFPVSASPFPIYQSSLIAVTPNHFPKFLPVLVILAVISGFVVILPEITYFFMNIAKSFKSKPMFYCPPASLPSQFASSKLPISLVSLLLLWTGPPAIATFFTFVWFTSILFSYERSSNMIVTILQWCGLLIAQDTRTPPLLDAIYEQITRGTVEYSDLVLSSDLSDEHDKYQVITDYSLDYSHLTVPHNTHELDLQNTPMQMESQEPEVSLQRIHSEPVDSQSFYRQLELLRAREQKLDADLLASEQEREALVENLYVSRRNQQGWKEIAGVAKSLYLESEMIISNLRADLADAMDHVRNVEEQLDHQIELASGKDSVVKSITKELRLADIRLRIANHKIDQSDVALQEERDRRIREKEELMREKAMIEDRHKSEIRRLIQEAQDAQEQLNALRHTVSQLRSDDHPLGSTSSTTWPYDTGQPPLPPERNIDSGTPPGPGSSYGSTRRSPCSPTQNTMGTSTCLAARLPEIPGFCDQESEAVKEQRVAPVEVTEPMGQMEPESAEDMKPSKGDEIEVSNATKEQLRLAEEEVRDLRRELGQSRESLREVEAHVKELEHELDICQATVRDAQDAQHASEVKLTEATQLLRIHQAESESSMARAEESQFKCSQVTFLCTALRERITKLEAKIMKLKNSRKYRANSSSRSRSPIDLEAITHDPGTQESDSIFMTVPLSMPCLLDLPLPPSSPLSNDSSLYLSHEECPIIPLVSVDSGSCCPTNTDLDANIHNTDAQTHDSSFMASPSCLPCLLDLPSPPSLSQSSSSSFFSSRRKRPEIPPTCTVSHSSSPIDNDLDVTTPDTDLHDWPVPPPRSEGFSLSPFHLPRTFLSERNSPSSVDCPPIEPSLLPEHGNDRQDDNSLRSLTEENENDSILLNPKALSPIKELDELDVSERHTSHDHDRPDRETWGLSQQIQTPHVSPNWILSSPQILTRERPVDISVTPEGKLASRDHVSGPPPLHLPLPVFPRITLPRVSFSPSGIDRVLEPPLESSESGIDKSDTEVGSAVPDTLLDDPLSSTQSGEFHSTEALSPGTVTRGGKERHFSRISQDDCWPVPTHDERLDPISTASPAGVMSSWTSTYNFSLQVHPPSVSSALDCQGVQRSLPSVDAQPSQTAQPDTLLSSIPAHLEGCDGPTVVVGSIHKGIDSDAGTSSSRTALGSLPSGLRNSIDQGTSMRARRGPAPQSGDVTSARSHLAQEAFISSSDDSPITASRSSDLPLSEVSNSPHVVSPRKDAKTQAVKGIPKSMSQSPTSHLVLELLDQAFIQLDEASFDGEDSPFASGKAGKGRHLSDYNISFSQRDTSSPGCFLPGDSVSRFSFRSVALEGQDHDFEDFAFFIPPDCPTSTPVASRTWASRKCSAGSGVAASAGVER